jgi:hypothetical protein
LVVEILAKDARNVFELKNDFAFAHEKITPSPAPPLQGKAKDSGNFEDVFGFSKQSSKRRHKER